MCYSAHYARGMYVFHFTQLSQISRPGSDCLQIMKTEDIISAFQKCPFQLIIKEQSKNPKGLLTKNRFCEVLAWDRRCGTVLKEYVHQIGAGEEGAV